MSDERETARALGISVNAQVDAGRQIVFQTHIDVDTSQEDLDALLDKLNVAADRQVAFYEIPVLEKELQHLDLQEYTFKNNLQNMDANLAAKQAASTGRRSDVKLSAQEEIQKRQAMDTLNHHTKLRASAAKRLEEARAKAGTRHGTASTANR